MYVWSRATAHRAKEEKKSAYSMFDREMRSFTCILASDTAFALPDESLNSSLITSVLFQYDVSTFPVSH